MGGARLSQTQASGLPGSRAISCRAVVVVLLILVALLATAGTADAELVAAPVVSGAARAGQTLTADHGTWAGAEPFTYAYQWYRCNSSGGECSEVVGKTGETYALADADVGHKLQVAVTATNEEGSEEAQSATTATIAPGTSTAGVADPTQSLLVMPTYDPIESSNLDLEDETPVFVVQSMPKPMTVSSVTIGDFARASGCGSDASVQLKVYAFPSDSTLSSGTLLAQSSAARPFGSSLGEVSWQIPATELELGSTYGFFVKGASGSCAAAIERSWAHNHEQVNGGSAACDVVLGSAGIWRLWHTESHADSGECHTISSLSNFSSSLPTGWAQVDQAGEGFSINTTPGECATGLGATETSFGEGHVACRFPQFTKPGETTADGWYYGLPWEGPGLSGAPRDLYFRLDPAPLPSGRLIAPPGQLSATTATLEAIIDPKGRETQYQIHWSRTGASGDLPEHPVDIGSRTGPVTVSQQLEGLKPSTTYHYYLTLYTPNDPPIDKKLSVEAYSATFTTPAKPEVPEAPNVTTGSSSEIGATSAKIDGAVVPMGDDTHYWFEWGRDPSLSAPARSASEDLGSGSAEVPVTHQLWGLQPDTTYYYRVVAVDSFGTHVEGEIESFSTSLGELQNLVPPQLEGVTDVGREVSASAGRWRPEPATSEDHWERCNTLGAECSAIEGATGSSYVPEKADAGKTLRVTESVEDPEGASGSVASAVSKVINPFSMLVWPLSPPTIIGPAAEGQTLIAGHGDWSGEAPFSYEYQWQRCDSGGSGCADIEGATQSTYPLEESNVGATVRLIVTATGGGAWDSAVTEPTGIVVKPAVAVTSGPSIDGSAAYEQTLTAEHGSWTGAEGATYTYQWLRCDAEGTDCEPLEGETEETYGLGAEDLGSTLRVSVTAHGAEASGEAISPASEVVAEATPINAAPPTIVGPAVEGQTMQAELGDWSGSDLGFAFQWETCNASGAECEEIFGATERSYVPVKEEVGRTLRVLVVASNELGSVSETSEATSALAARGTLVDTGVPAITGTAQAGAAL